MTDPIETSVLDARTVIGHTLEELAGALEKLDVSLAELRALQATVYRAALASHPPVLPENVKPIRARAV